MAGNTVMSRLLEKGTTTRVSEQEGANLLCEEVKEVTVRAAGKDLTELVDNLFRAMRVQVYSQVGQPIVQMTAESVVFDELEKTEATERFLFLLWPRKKVSYKAVATIGVRVKYLGVERSTN